MNKKSKSPIDKSAPYRSLGLNKIAAPVKATGEPKSRTIKTEGDLRVKGGKQ